MIVKKQPTNASRISKRPHQFFRLGKIYKVTTISSFVLLGACTQVSDKELRRSSDGPQEPLIESIAEEQDSLALRANPNRVLVVLKEKPSELVQQALDRLPGSNLNAAALAQRVADIKKIKTSMVASISAADVTVERDYDQLPVLRVRVSSPEALAKLTANPNVKAIYPDEQVKRTISSSFPFIGQPETIALGYTGQETAVAVLDTGVDYTRAAFGSCSAPGIPAETCRVAFAKDFATEDNVLDDSDLHGTNVAGIVAGLAPSTKILALDVFDGGSAYSSVIIEAINWAIANKATYNIAALNMSLGGAVYSEPCSTRPISVAIQNARDAGILSAVASGNDAQSNAIAYPGCAAAAVSVGAVYDKSYDSVNWSVCSDPTTAADQVACFSNSASFLTMLAPGVGINAAGIGMSGTSQATPHVAGAIAILRSAFPELSTNGIVDRLTSKGVSITDPRNSITKPRLNLLAAVTQNCDLSLSPKKISAGPTGGLYTVNVSTGPTCEWSLAEDADWIEVIGDTGGTGPKAITIQVSALDSGSRTGKVEFSGVAAPATLDIQQDVDTDAPTGTVVINDGATYTKTRTVNLTIAASDPSGLKEMCISTATSCTSWQPFSQSTVFILDDRQGLATVRVWLRDNANNTTLVPITDTITLDSIAPTMGSLRGTVTRTSINLVWSPARDLTSGVAAYKVVYFEGLTIPAATCTNGTSVPVTQSNRVVISSLKRRTTYTLRLCAIDRAGNVSPGIAARGTTSR